MQIPAPDLGCVRLLIEQCQEDPDQQGTLVCYLVEHLHDAARRYRKTLHPEAIEIVAAMQELSQRAAEPEAPELLRSLERATCALAEKTLPDPFEALDKHADTLGVRPWFEAVRRRAANARTRVLELLDTLTPERLAGIMEPAMAEGYSSVTLFEDRWLNVDSELGVALWERSTDRFVVERGRLGYTVDVRVRMDDGTETMRLSSAFLPLAEAVGMNAVSVCRPNQREWETDTSQRLEQLEAQMAEVRHAPGMPGYLEAEASFCQRDEAP